MKRMTLTFTFEDNGSIAIYNHEPVLLSGLDTVKMIMSFLAYHEKYSNTETINYAIQSYEDGLAQIGETYDPDKPANTTRDQPYHRARKYHTKRTQS